MTISDLIKPVKKVEDIPAFLRLTGDTATTTDSGAAKEEAGGENEPMLSSEEDVSLYA